MSKLHLTAEELVCVQTILMQWVPNAEVWAYGSRVNGTGHDASDLDLVIRNSTSLTTPTAKISQLKQAFRDSELAILVDVMDWAMLPETFKSEINKNYVKLI